LGKGYIERKEGDIRSNGVQNIKWRTWVTGPLHRPGRQGLLCKRAREARGESTHNLVAKRIFFKNLQQGRSGMDSTKNRGNNTIRKNED